MKPDALLDLLQRFQVEGVAYVLVGGHAVGLNGFNRTTEDIDILLPSSVENGRRVIRALSFLPSSQELVAEWFAPPADEPENIRVADALLINMLFAANGQTYESLQDHVRTLTVDGVRICTLDIEGSAQNQDRLPVQGQDRPRSLVATETAVGLSLTASASTHRCLLQLLALPFGDRQHRTDGGGEHVRALLHWRQSAYIAFVSQRQIKRRNPLAHGAQTFADVDPDSRQMSQHLAIVREQQAIPLLHGIKDDGRAICIRKRRTNLNACLVVQAAYRHAIKCACGLEPVAVHSGELS